MDILISGSIAYDYLMQFPGRFKDHILLEHLNQVSLSFLVEEMSKHWGGVGANVAYTMGLLGLRPKLFSTVGRDFPEYRAWLEKAGVDTSAVIQHDDVFTASFFANTDLDNNQISSFYSGAMKYARDHKIADVHPGKPDLVLISPNDPQAMMQYVEECRQRGIPFVYDPGQQVARLNGDELRVGFEGAYMMIVNQYESELIMNKTGLTLAQMQDMIALLVITQGKHGSHIYHQGQRTEVEAFPQKEINDPTGVGDAYRAGLLTGVANGWPLHTAGLVGALCATYVLEQIGTQNHHFTLPEFVSRFRSYYDDQGALDSLLQAAPQPRNAAVR